MLAGLLQMCADDLASAPQQPITLVFEHPAARYRLAPDGAGWSLTISAGDGTDDGTDDTAPEVRSTVHDFVSWGTKRSDWREAVTGDTAEPDVAEVLDAIKVI